jgi:L-galactose dehydrogenase
MVTETLPALQELQAAGKARHLGITGLPLKVYRTVLSRVPPATLDVALSYCHFCLNDRTLETLLPDLEAAGLGVINASCLCMGLLTSGGPPAWHPAPAALKEAAERAAAAATEAGCDIARLALMWALKVWMALQIHTQSGCMLGPLCIVAPLQSERLR